MSTLPFQFPRYYQTRRHQWPRIGLTDTREADTPKTYGIAMLGKGFNISSGESQNAQGLLLHIAADFQKTMKRLAGHRKGDLKILRAPRNENPGISTGRTSVAPVVRPSLPGPRKCASRSLPIVLATCELANWFGAFVARLGGAELASSTLFSLAWL